MSKENMLIFFGFLTILAPFSGLPTSWLDFVLPLLGLAVIFIGFAFRGERTSENETHLEPLEAEIPSV